jgi:hypothetical protein
MAGIMLAPNASNKNMGIGSPIAQIQKNKPAPKRHPMTGFNKGWLVICSE